MIEIIKVHTYAIHLKLNADGAKRLTAAFHAASTDTNTHAVGIIRFDRSITKGKRFNKLIERELLVRQSNNEIIQEDAEQVILMLEIETIIYAIEKFKEALIVGNFFPAELCQLYIKNSNQLSQLYCILSEE